MTIAELEKRLAALEFRVRAAEDQLDILRLLNQYGPLVDSGAGPEAAALWSDGGGYEFSTSDGGLGRLEAPIELAALYQSRVHLDLVEAGSAHLTATPAITLNGDSADAVGYSFVVRRDADRWIVVRAAINHWTLVRTSAGWRVAERRNRVLDGSQSSFNVMRAVLTPPA